MKDEFNLEAKIYDKIWGKHDYDTDVKFLNKLFKKYGCKRVIDIGCGTGNHTLRLSKMRYEVTGFDISPAMLEIAERKARNSGLNIGFVQGDMKKLENIIPKGEKFDSAICLGQTFSHLITNRDVHLFLNGLRKVLKKNALFIFNARNARKIREDRLDNLFLDHILVEKEMQLLLLSYNTRYTRDRNVIVWRPIYLMKEGDKVDFQIREHKLRWFQYSSLKKMLIENGFKIVATYSGVTGEEFEEDGHVEMWFVTVVK